MNKLEKITLHILQNRWKYLVLELIIVIVSILGLYKVELDSAIENWFPKDTEYAFNYQEFEKHFGNADMVGIHLKTKDVFSPEIIQMLKDLEADIEKNVSHIDKITTIADMEYTYSENGEIITEPLLPENPNAEDIAKAKKRILSKPYLKNNFVSDDFTETWILVSLLPYDKKHYNKNELAPENKVGKEILDVLKKKKYAGYTLRPVGTPLYNYEELMFTSQETTRLIVITLIVLIIFLSLFYRSVKKVVIPMLTTIVSIIIVFGIMGYAGIKINSLLLSVPVIFTLAVSLGFSVHFVNYYHSSLLNAKDTRKALMQTVSLWTRPTGFATFTTIIALMSFLFIDLVPINWLGLTSASLILTVFVNTMILSVVLLSFDNSAKANKQETSGFYDKITRKISQFVVLYPKRILISFSIFSLIMLVGLYFVQVNFDIKHSYGNKVPYVNRMVQVANTQIGTFDNYNITVEFPEKNSLKKVNILKKIDTFQKEIQRLELTKKANSLLDIIKDLNKLINDDNPTEYKLPEKDKQVAQLLMLYEMSGGSKLSDWTNDNYNIIRISVGLKTMDAKKSLEEMNYLRKTAKQLFPDAKINFTGSLPRLAELNRMITVGQIKSLLIALLLIGVLLMLAFGSFKIGLIGLVPNIFPIITVGGIMGFLDIPIDFLTVTVTPMILGIAVDDTIHIFNHIKNLYRKTQNYKKTVTETIQELGKAVITTTLVIILAFAVFLFSSFNMMRNLGLLIVVGMTAALVADLFISPLLILWLKPFNKNK